MSIHTEKLHLMKLILETENPKVLESIKNIFSKEGKVDFWSTLTNEQKLEIESGIADFANDDTVDYDVVMSKHRK